MLALDLHNQSTEWLRPMLEFHFIDQVYLMTSTNARLL